MSNRPSKNLVSWYVPVAFGNADMTQYPLNCSIDGSPPGMRVYMADQADAHIKGLADEAHKHYQPQIDDLIHDINRHLDALSNEARENKRLTDEVAHVTRLWQADVKARPAVETSEHNCGDPSCTGHPCDGAL